LIYGSCNYPSERTPSSEEFAQGPILSDVAVNWFWQQYLADPAIEQHHAWASPARAASHANLPPAFVASAELDPTRDDGERYGEILSRAGVASECRRYEGMPHGFVSWLGLVDRAQHCIDDACAFLARHNR
jgi:acetyl esterase